MTPERKLTRKRLTKAFYLYVILSSLVVAFQGILIRINPDTIRYTQATPLYPWFLLFIVCVATVVLPSVISLYWYSLVHYLEWRAPLPNPHSHYYQEYGWDEYEETIFDKLFRIRKWPLWGLRMSRSIGMVWLVLRMANIQTTIVRDNPLLQGLIILGLGWTVSQFLLNIQGSLIKKLLYPEESDILLELGGVQTITPAPLK